MNKHPLESAHDSLVWPRLNRLMNIIFVLASLIALWHIILPGTWRIITNINL